MENQILPLTHVYFPFIDETTPAGYIILCTIQIAAVVSGTLVTSAWDFLIATALLNTGLFAKIMSLEMEEIDIDFEHNVKMINIRARFRNILRMHQELIGLDKLLYIF